MAIPESVALLLNGLELRCPAHPRPCRYVRFVDPRSGKEIERYTAVDLLLRPRRVLGRIMAMLMGSE